MNTKCPLCNYPFELKDGIYISFNGLCYSCARTTYIVFRDVVGEEPSDTKPSENK